MTQNMSELESITTQEFITPRPLDPEIMGGVAIVGALHEDTVEQVTLRLQQSFDIMRAKAVHPANASRKKEIGQCIAYSALELGSTDIELMDSFTREVSAQQNHGMKTSDASPQELAPNFTQLWLGFDAQSKHNFALVRSVGTLILEDHSLIHRSSIWALKAAPKTPSWGWA